MYSYSDIKQVHLEVTSYCNASCPQCPRNMGGGILSPNLALKHLSLADCKHIFPVDFVAQLNYIFLCGNYGDPIMASETIEILDYFREANPNIKLGIHTNASGRNQSWWERLAKVVSFCKFSIDGLEDTNFMYRRHTEWHKIMNSAKWFIEAGGIAIWDFLVFRHNQHQVEEAYELSKNMGFARFNIKKTSRFYDPNAQFEDFKSDVKNHASAIVYSIEPPDDPRYANAMIKQLPKLIKTNEAFEAYLESTSIRCGAVVEKQIYVSAEGLVFPCCYLGNIYGANQSFNEKQLCEILDTLPQKKYTLSAKKQTIPEIIAGDYFQKIVPESWKKKTMAEGRIYACAKNCGTFNLKTTSSRK